MPHGHRPIIQDNFGKMQHSSERRGMWTDCIPSQQMHCISKTILLDQKCWCWSKLLNLQDFFGMHLHVLVREIYPHKLNIFSHNLTIIFIFWGSTKFSQPGVTSVPIPRDLSIWKVHLLGSCHPGWYLLLCEVATSRGGGGSMDSDNNE